MAWSTEVHLLPINWQPVSNASASWSKATSGSKRSSRNSRKSSHIKRRSSPSSKRWPPHTRSNWRRPRSNCVSSSGRCSANVANGMHPRPIRRCFSCPKPSKDWGPRNRASQKHLQGPPHLGLDESHDGHGSSSRNSGSIAGPSIRCLQTNCLVAAAEPSGSSSAPTSRSGRKWKRPSCTWSKKCGSPTAVPTATTARRCRPPRGRRRPWRKAPSGRASWPRW